MNLPRTLILPALVFAGFSSQVFADALDEIRNYREYSPLFSSAGQPSEEQLQDLGEAGFERIVYIAFANSRGAIADEDQRVKDLGMDYVQIPVVWEAPTRADFELFAAAMESAPGKRTLLHCQANYRASAFAFLYRVLYRDVPMSEAKADMNSVWMPDGAWKQLIFELLEAHGKSPDCAGCDWSSEG